MSYERITSGKSVQTPLGAVLQTTKYIGLILFAVVAYFMYVVSSAINTILNDFTYTLWWFEVSPIIKLALFVLTTSISWYIILGFVGVNRPRFYFVLMVLCVFSFLGQILSSPTKIMDKYMCYDHGTYPYISKKTDGNYGSGIACLLIIKGDRASVEAAQNIGDHKYPRPYPPESFRAPKLRSMVKNPQYMYGLGGEIQFWKSTNPNPDGRSPIYDAAGLDPTDTTRLLVPAEPEDLEKYLDYPFPTKKEAEEKLKIAQDKLAKYWERYNSLPKTSPSISGKEGDELVVPYGYKPVSPQNVSKIKNGIYKVECPDSLVSNFLKYLGTSCVATLRLAKDEAGLSQELSERLGDVTYWTIILKKADS